ncbi:MAG TPA: SMR family transporter [Bryobacteraceae bacterium]|jgi:multidrug transporter EmrE-like cation transporter|nr:SMR family transporter [Bryobacteraceae bacterium]
MYLLLLIAASLLFATGGLFMKLSLGLTRLTPSLLVFVLFCAGASCQAIAMRRADMGVAYVLVLGLEAVAAFLISIFALNESAAPARVIAVLLIVSGIVLLERT